MEGPYVKHLGQIGCGSHIKWMPLSINHKQKKKKKVNGIVSKSNIEQTIWTE